MSAAAAKESAGYVAATHRDRCANCRHCGSVHAFINGAKYSHPQCMKHGFAIKPGAICSSYERAITPPRCN